jgi:hypothetical protein
VIVTEAVNRGTDKIDFLIKHGLGSDQSKLPYYRTIIQNPQQAAQSVVLRKYMAEVFDNLLKLVFEDAVLYNRVRQLLVAKGSKMAAMKPSAFESLVANWMSVSDDIPFDQVIEEYEIGYEDDTRPRHLTKEQYAFNRVNSLLHGGRKTIREQRETSKALTTIQKLVRKKHGTV